MFYYRVESLDFLADYGVDTSMFREFQKTLRNDNDKAKSDNVSMEDTNKNEVKTDQSKKRKVSERDSAHEPTASSKPQAAMPLDAPTKYSSRTNAGKVVNTLNDHLPVIEEGTKATIEVITNVAKYKFMNENPKIKPNGLSAYCTI